MTHTKNELVSVVIISYKRSFEMVKRALDSVIAQTYTNLEILIVDDNNSTSDFSEKLEEGIKSIADPRIRLIKHYQNKGANVARNTGIQNASGKYIAFLDDDDEWLPEKTRTKVDIFNTDGDLGLVYCGNYIQLDNNPRKVERGTYLQGDIFNNLLYKNYVGGTSFVMIKKEVVDACGVFAEHMKASQDYEYWLRIAKMYPVYGIKTPLGIYYAHKSDRISSSVHNKISGYLDINKMYEEDLKTNKTNQCKRELVLAPLYIKRDGYIKGLAYSFKVFFHYPIATIKVLWLEVKERL